MVKEYKVDLKRVYEAVEKSDGFRILVDRLWPKGLSKEKARIDLWLKDLSQAMSYDSGSVTTLEIGQNFSRQEI